VPDLRRGVTARCVAVDNLPKGLGGRLKAFYFAFGENDAYLILPESSAECVEQQSSTESARTKEIKRREDPSKPLKKHGCEPKRREDRLCCALFRFSYGGGNRRRLICSYRSAGGINAQSCIHVSL
jgi:hypothetical protein